MTDYSLFTKKTFLETRSELINEWRSGGNREANREISKKNEELRKEVSELWYFKERFEIQLKIIEDLNKQLNSKRSVVKVIQVKDNIRYVLQVVKAFDTSEGLLIEVI